MVKFHELPYFRPDIERYKREVSQTVYALQNAVSFTEADAALLTLDQLDRDFMTMSTIASIRHDINTLDPFYEKETEYLDEQIPTLAPLNKARADALLDSPFREELEAKYGHQFFRTLEANRILESELIIPERQKEAELCQKFNKLVAAQSVEFRGETCNFYGLLAQMENPDRSIRREALKAWSSLYEGIADQLDEIYDRLIELRVTMAEKLGFRNFTEMGYLQMGRFEYGPAEVAEFRKQIREVVTPACAKIHEAQAKRLGLDKLEYYDEALLFTDGNANPIGGTDKLVPAASQMYHDLSETTGKFFDFMTEHELFDLETRPGKHMGGYCTALAKYNAPFIFSNFNGTLEDEGVLTHEAGHCLNAYLASRTNPLAETAFPSSEACEIHSMSMELFALPYINLFVGDKDADKAAYAVLCGAVLTIPYLVAVDEFQHEVYANPKMSAKERRAVWHRIEKTYMPWRSYDGIEFLEEGGFWMQKQHIFLYPFYYVDYALAETGALEFYGRNKADHESTWGDYLRLCAAGGPQSYLNLLKLANLSNPFEAGTVERALGYVLPDIEALEKKLVKPEKKAKITLNEDKAVVAMIREGLKAKNGHCPCKREISDDTVCMCKEFREQIVDPNFEGYCHCLLYKKSYE